MTDVPFKLHTFKGAIDGVTLPTGIVRTQPDRIGESFVSVREFGAITAGSTCRATLQAAIDSGHNLYFPQGYYVIDGPIIIPNDDHHRVIMGAGPNPASATSSGTIIRGNFRDYLWKSNQVFSAPFPISAISGIHFQNQFSIGAGAPVTQVDPPASSGWSGPHPGDCLGGLYLSLSWCRITNVIISIGSGLGLYYNGIDNYIGSFVCHAGLGDLNFSCGIWSGSVIECAKVHDCLYGLALPMGPTSVIDVDIERCLWGIATFNPLPYWDRNMDTVFTTAASGAVRFTGIGLNFESCGGDALAAAGLGLGGAMHIRGDVQLINCHHHAGQQLGRGDYHYLLDGGVGIFDKVTASNEVNIAGMAVKDQAGVYDSIFTMCSMDNCGAGIPAWRVFNNPDDVSNRKKGLAGYLGHKFIHCNTNGAREFRRLPGSPPTYLNELLINDCTLPEVSYSTSGVPTSNSGKTVLASGGGATGGGSYLTTVVCRPIISLAATAAWTTASTTLTVTANPGQVLPGMDIWHAATGQYVGTVATFTTGTTTLVLAQNPYTDIYVVRNTAEVPGAAGDVLTFAAWTIK